MAAQKKGSKPAPKQTAAKKKPAQKPAQAAKKNSRLTVIQTDTDLPAGSPLLSPPQG